jgi:glutamine synthetase
MNEIQEILQKFLNLKIKVAFGFEFEFYLVDQNNKPIKNTTNIIQEIQFFLQRENFFAYVDQEKEIGQLEICSIATFDIIKNIDQWIIILKKLKSQLKKQNIFLNHKAKPFLDKAGNGLHINISLHDLQNSENLFSFNNNYRNDIKNKLMAYSIGGLLKNIEEKINQFIFNESTILRIQNSDRNTTTNFSWGQNNRTTMIRIPESLPNLKRIENRLPSSENNLYKMVFLTLEGIFEGIINKIDPIQCIYGLAFQEQYNFLKKII